MKNNNHDVESRIYTTRSSNVPGTIAAEQCNLHSPINLLYWGSRVFCLSLLLLFTILPQSGFSSSSMVSPLPHTIVSGIIVMEADIIKADTGDEEVEINELRVYNSNFTLVYRKTDCNGSLCEIYAGNFNPGMYLVVAYTSENQTFSDHVFKS